MMLIFLLCVSAAVVSQGSAQNCPIITASELGSTTVPSSGGIVPDSLRENTDGDDARPVLLIYDYQITCSVAGNAPETYQRLSIVVALFCDGGAPSGAGILACGATSSPLGGAGNFTIQIDMICEGTTWERGTGVDIIGNTVENTLAIPANGALSTDRDFQCRSCINNRLRNVTLGSVTYDVENHCVSCTGACLNVGLGLCEVFPPSSICCSFYQDTGMGFRCVENCTENFVANASFFCIPICADLNETANAQLGYSPSDPPRFVDTVATYSCDQGFNIDGNPSMVSIERVCQSNGTWTASHPSCLIATCPSLSIQGGSVEYAADTGRGNLEFGSVASYKCDDLFVLTEDVMRTCERTETWSGTEPKCEPCPTKCARCSYNSMTKVVECLECDDKLELKGGQCIVSRPVSGTDICIACIVGGIVGGIVFLLILATIITLIIVAIYYKHSHPKTQVKDGDTVALKGDAKDNNLYVAPGVVESAVEPPAAEEP